MAVVEEAMRNKIKGDDIPSHRLEAVDFGGEFEHRGALGHVKIRTVRILKGSEDALPAVLVGLHQDGQEQEWIFELAQARRLR